MRLRAAAGAVADLDRVGCVDETLPHRVIEHRSVVIVLGGPGIRVGVQVHQRERPMACCLRAQQRIRHEVVAAQTKQGNAGIENPSGSLLP